MEEIWIHQNGDKNRRRGKKVNCKQCNTEFIIRLKSDIQYCSLKCMGLASQNRVQLNCENCGQEFWKTESKLKLSKHKKYFCSRKCKDFAQSFRGSCQEIRPSHYSDLDNPSNPQNLIKWSNDPKCVDCKESRIYLLNIHHIDGNRENNQKKNLEIVCCNCHTKRHLRMTDNGWVIDFKELTDRKLLMGL